MWCDVMWCDVMLCYTTSLSSKHTPILYTPSSQQAYTQHYVILSYDISITTFSIRMHRHLIVSAHIRMHYLLLLLTLLHTISQQQYWYSRRNPSSQAGVYWCARRVLPYSHPTSVLTLHIHVYIVGGCWNLEFICICSMQRVWIIDL
jgi:hypothetical protein